MSKSGSGAPLSWSPCASSRVSGVGGEWGGSVLLSMEWARNDQRSRVHRLLAAIRRPAGLFLANLAVLAFSQLAGDQFLSWGWRVPFLLSLILVVVGLWIRLGILETPIFQQARRGANSVKPFRGLQAPAKRDHPQGIPVRDRRMVVYIYVYTLSFSRMVRQAVQLAEPDLAGGADRVFHGVLTISPFRLSVGPPRAQKNLILGAIVRLFAFSYFAMFQTGSLLIILPSCSRSSPMLCFTDRWRR